MEFKPSNRCKLEDPNDPLDIQDMVMFFVRKEEARRYHGRGVEFRPEMVKPLPKQKRSLGYAFPLQIIKYLMP